MSWSKDVVVKINNIRKTILKKKIMFNLVVNSYTFKDKVFKWSHKLLAIIIPILTSIQATSSSQNTSSNTAALIFSIIVAAMIHIRDYIEFDKIKEAAKGQSVKYNQIYNKIETELLKPENTRTSGEEFVYWLIREYNNVEMTDPEISEDDHNKYVDFCKLKGIPPDEDIDMLDKLIKADTATLVASVTVRDEIKESVEENKKDANETKSDTRGQLPCITEEPIDKKEYTHQVNTLNTKTDIQWSLERLNMLNT